MGIGHGFRSRGSARTVSARQILAVRPVQIDQCRRHGRGRAKSVERNVVRLGSVVEQRYRRRDAQEFLGQGLGDGVGWIRNDYRSFVHGQLGRFSRARETKDQTFRNQ